MAFPLASSSPTAKPVGRLLGSRWRRLGLALSLGLAAIVVLAFAPANASAKGRAGTYVGVKSYYLSLGDSLAFGYQPNGSWNSGYAQQWFTNLKAHGSSTATYYGCLGETSATFINGGCPYWWLLHNPYAGAQLNAAVAFIKAHPGQVSPVSLDIGANDLLPDINSSTCAISSNWSTDLANLDTRLTGTILPQLTKALTNRKGVRTGDLVMMNYYDPYQNQCPASVPYLQTLNAHLAADVAQFNVPVSDVFTAFGGAGVPDPNTCSYTWICSTYHDIHATTTGYGVIAGAFESTTGY